MFLWSILAWISSKVVYITWKTSYGLLNAIFEKLIICVFMVKFSIDIFENRLYHLEDVQNCSYYLTREQRDIMSFWREKKWKQTNLWRKKCFFLSIFDKISRSNFKIFLWCPEKNRNPKKFMFILQKCSYYHTREQREIMSFCREKKWK